MNTTMGVRRKSSGGGKNFFLTIWRLKIFPGGGQKKICSNLYLRKQRNFQILTNKYQIQVRNRQNFEIHYDFENPGGPQWEKSCKIVPLGKMKKNLFESQINFVGLILFQYNKKMWKFLSLKSLCRKYGPFTEYHMLMLFFEIWAPKSWDSQNGTYQKWIF